MTVTRLAARMTALAAVLTSMDAFAQAPAAPGGESPPPAVTTGASAEAFPSRMRVGLNLTPTPFGKVTFSTGGFSGSSDLAFAFGIMPFFDYLLTPNFFIGVGPTYTFNIKGKDADGSAAKELDLLLRVGGGAPISDTMQLYGYLAPGYSIIMVPEGDQNPKGFVLGIHAGGMYTVSPTVFLNGELGYQLGYQKVSLGGMTSDFKTSYMQIALGGGIRL